MNTPSLYHYPFLYNTLLAPVPLMWDRTQEWIHRYLEGRFEKVLDPACGPGNWLLPFARNGLFVAGNDIEARMIEGARTLLSGFASELTVGDMRCLAMNSGPFDVAVNYDSSIGHLPDDEAVLQHFESVGQNLRKGGLFFVGLTVMDLPARTGEPMALFESGRVTIPQGGEASVVYTCDWRDPHLRREQISLEVQTWDVPNCPTRFHESYQLLTFPVERLRALLNSLTCLKLRAIRTLELFGFPEQELTRNCGDLVLILERI